MRTLPLVLVALSALVLGCAPVLPEDDDDLDGFISDDCADNDATVYPGAEELCDGLDNDCDDDIDEGLDPVAFYLDADDDGYGDSDLSVSACIAPEGYVAVGADCDDTRMDIHPNAPETDCTDPIDYNCDGASGAVDNDADGYAACEECDDTTAARSPGNAEICDDADIDEDCDGLADNDDGSATGGRTYYADFDDDGYGDLSSSVSTCDAPTGYTTVTDDCDDTDPSVNPSATEVCDTFNTDEDCDGAADNADSSATGQNTWYRDVDGDGYGISTLTTTACDAPGGYVANASDCNDGNANIRPGGTEVCDASNVDEDCDGLADDADSSATGKSTWYADSDGDGYGSASSATTGCEKPAGTVTNDDDCNDGNAGISPADVEVCEDGTDQDCSGADRSCTAGFESVSAGGYHTCGVKTDGTVVCWGNNYYGQSTPPSGTFEQVTAGECHTCGMKTDGTVTCWGDNYYGQSTPKSGTFEQVIAGAYFTCGVKTDGTVTCWGDNYYGQLSPKSGTFEQVGAGRSHTCGLKIDGTVACWGRSDSGQSTPPSGTFEQVSAGAYHTCGLKADGTIACWGDNAYGQSSPPIGTFEQVAGGYFHTCAVKTDGTIACWGVNIYGQSTPPAP